MFANKKINTETIEILTRENKRLKRENHQLHMSLDELQRYKDAYKALINEITSLKATYKEKINELYKLEGEYRKELDTLNRNTR